jgi:hypothetical protein
VTGSSGLAGMDRVHRLELSCSVKLGPRRVFRAVEAQQSEAGGTRMEASVILTWYERQIKLNVDITDQQSLLII